jgi:rhodanese-related sulfurtransferase
MPDPGKFQTRFLPVLLPAAGIVLLAAASALLAALWPQAWFAPKQNPAGALAQNPAELTLEAFAAGIGQPGTVILDARSPEAYALGHVCGAQNLPDSAFPNPAFGRVLAAFKNQSSRLFIYCSSSSCQAAANLAKALQRAGIPAERIAVFAPGWAVLEFTPHVPKCTGATP